MGKTCNKCGKKELEWNKKHHERTGKWKLEDHKNKEGEWCVRNDVKSKSYIASKKDIILCEYCKDSNFGLCRSKEDYIAHVKAYHPNREILTNLDYMMQHNGKMDRATLKNWKSDAHYSHWNKFIREDMEG